MSATKEKLSRVAHRTARVYRVDSIVPTVSRYDGDTGSKNSSNAESVAFMTYDNQIKFREEDHGHGCAICLYIYILNLHNFLPTQKKSARQVI